LEVEENTQGASHITKSAVEVLDCISQLMTISVQLCEKSAREQAMPDAGKTRRRSRKVFGNSLVRTFSESFGQDLHKYFFTPLPFSCANESLQPTMVNINLRMFHAAAALKVMDKDKEEKFKSYVRSCISKRFLDSEHVNLALEVMTHMRSAGIGQVAAEFLVHTITESSNSSVAYDFMHQLLSLQPGHEYSYLRESVDWNKLAVMMAENLICQTSSENSLRILSVLTLLSIRNLGDVEAIVKKNSSYFVTDFLQQYTSAEARNHIQRLLYYTNMLSDDKLAMII